MSCTEFSRLLIFYGASKTKNWFNLLVLAGLTEENTANNNNLMCSVRLSCHCLHVPCESDEEEAPPSALDWLIGSGCGDWRLPLAYHSRASETTICNTRPASCFGFSLKTVWFFEAHISFSNTSPLNHHKRNQILDVWTKCISFPSIEIIIWYVTKTNSVLDATETDLYRKHAIINTLLI